MKSEECSFKYADVHIDLSVCCTTWLRILLDMIKIFFFAFEYDSLIDVKQF